jgi:hypothetical protein
MAGPKIASPLATARMDRRISALSAPLEQVAAGAGLQGGEHRVVVEHAHHHDPDVGAGVQDAGGRLDAAQPRHLQVHLDHVGLEAGGERDRLLAGAGLADDRDVGCGGKQGAQPGAEVLVVVGDQEGRWAPS